MEALSGLWSFVGLLNRRTHISKCIKQTLVTGALALAMASPLHAEVTRKNCQDYADLARAVAVERDNGITEQEEIQAIIRQNFDSDWQYLYFLMIKRIYNDYKDESPKQMYRHAMPYCTAASASRLNGR